MLPVPKPDNFDPITEIFPFQMLILIWLHSYSYPCKFPLPLQLFVMFGYFSCNAHSSICEIWLFASPSTSFFHSFLLWFSHTPLCLPVWRGFPSFNLAICPIFYTHHFPVPSSFTKMVFKQKLENSWDLSRSDFPLGKDGICTYISPPPKQVFIFFQVQEKTVSLYNLPFSSIRFFPLLRGK